MQFLLDLLGWPGLAILVAVIGIALWALYRYGVDLFMWSVFRNFKAHGKVLHDARVEIHGVTTAPEPAPDPDDEEFEEMMDEAGVPDGDDGMRYFYVDATITPTQGPKALYHPEDGWDPAL